MPLETIASNFGQGGAKLTDQGSGGLKAVLNALTAAVETLQTEIAAVQDLQFTTVTGAEGSTNIAVPGLSVGDSIKHIVNLTDLVDVDLTGLVITAGNFKITASTASKKLLVIWQNKV